MFFQTKFSNRFPHFISGFFLFLWVFLFVEAMAQPGLTDKPMDKIDGEIWAHQRSKQKVANLAAKKRGIQLAKLGLNPDHLHSETVALYLDKPLSSVQISGLSTAGIHIHPGIWVPPVPGKHDHGFHLATVPYDRMTFLSKAPWVVRVASAEFADQAQNDLTRTMINVESVHLGSEVGPFTGKNVRIAVADSGLDLTHEDFGVPIETFDVTDGEGIENWDSDVANKVSFHGTHVTGIAVGRGVLSNGTYKGMAPDANLYFYKIGNDSSGSASSADEIEAIVRAQEVGCHIFNLSFGGISTYMDGTSPVCQAIDAASVAGMAVFSSAGNLAEAERHYSLNLSGPETSPDIRFAVEAGNEAFSDEQWIRIIWIGDPQLEDLELSCSNLGEGETFSREFQGNSIRGTRSIRYTLTPNLQANVEKTYVFNLASSFSGNQAVLFHLYRSSGNGTFQNADPSYTVSHPALADHCIAVGAWSHRQNWTAYEGNNWRFSDLTVNTLAPFSSIGPRIDGVVKPDIVAPGAATISCRDSGDGLADTETRIIDNDGLNLNGNGPADYYVTRGTSMASPAAAGAAALVLESNLGLNPVQLKELLTSTASQAGNPDNQAGYGLINLVAAVQAATGICTTVADENPRWVPHLTSPVGGFQTIVTLTSTATDSQTVTLVPYLLDGSPLAEVPVQLEAGTFRSEPAAELFGTDQASHFYVKGDDGVSVTAVYRVQEGLQGASAHALESTMVGTRFVLYQGEWDTVFDGLALVNTGDCPALVEGVRLDASGQESFRQVISEALAPNQKRLVNLNAFFPDRPGEQIVIESSEPAAVVFLRGSLGAGVNYLYQTVPIVIE